MKRFLIVMSVMYPDVENGPEFDQEGQEPVADFDTEGEALDFISQQENPSMFTIVDNDAQFDDEEEVEDEEFYDGDEEEGYDHFYRDNDDSDYDMDYDQAYDREDFHSDDGYGYDEDDGFRD